MITYPNETHYSPDFARSEFQCRGFTHGKGCCDGEFGRLHMDMEVIDYLQAIRWLAECPVRINSGYRCPTHNAREGGVPDSKHLEGLAVDFVVGPEGQPEVWSPEQVLAYTMAEWPEISTGIYDGFNHGDNRGIPPARWDKRVRDAGRPIPDYPWPGLITPEKPPMTLAEFRELQEAVAELQAWRKASV